MSDRQPKQAHQEAYLARWSRKKLQVGSEPEAPAKLHDSARPVSTAAPGHPPLTDADMPPLESLGADADYSGFLSPDISEGLRRLALRKLFHGAGFNVRDGLDDYDQDFTHFAGLGDLVTAEMKHRLEVEARRKSEKLVEQGRETPDIATPAGEEDPETQYRGSPAVSEQSAARRSDDSDTEGSPT